MIGADYSPYPEPCAGASPPCSRGGNYQHAKRGDDVVPRFVNVTMVPNPKVTDASGKNPGDDGYVTTYLSGGTSGTDPTYPFERYLPVSTGPDSCEVAGDPVTNEWPMPFAENVFAQPNMVKSVTLASGGTGYAAGDTVAVAGGTITPGGTAATIKVLTVDPVTGAILTAALGLHGSYLSGDPPSPNSVIEGSGTGATVNLVMTGETVLFKVCRKTGGWKAVAGQRSFHGWFGHMPEGVPDTICALTDGSGYKSWESVKPTVPSKIKYRTHGCKVTIDQTLKTSFKSAVPPNPNITGTISGTVILGVNATVDAESGLVTPSLGSDNKNDFTAVSGRWDDYAGAYSTYDRATYNYEVDPSPANQLAAQEATDAQESAYQYAYWTYNLAHLLNSKASALMQAWCDATMQDAINYFLSNDATGLTVTWSDGGVSGVDMDGNTIFSVTWSLSYEDGVLTGAIFTRTIYDYTLGTPYAAVTESVTLSPTALDFESTIVQGANYVNPSTQIISVVTTSGDALTSAEVDDDKNENLLAAWDLSDDKEHPWRHDMIFQAVPLMSRSEPGNTAPTDLHQWLVPNPAAPIDPAGGDPSIYWTEQDYQDYGPGGSPYYYSIWDVWPVWSGFADWTVKSDPNSDTDYVYVFYSVSEGQVVAGDPVSTDVYLPSSFEKVSGSLPPGLSMTFTTDPDTGAVVATISGTVTGTPEITQVMKDLATGTTISTTSSNAGGNYGALYKVTGTAKYDGTIKGAPRAAGYENFFDFGFQDYRGCKNPAGNLDLYLYGSGMNVADYNGLTGAQIPLNATQWVNNLTAMNKRQGAMMSYFDPIIIRGNQVGPPGLYSVKYAEIVDNWPSQNFARPGGGDKFLLDEEYDQTNSEFPVFKAVNISGGGAGSTWTVTNSTGGSPPDAAISGSDIWGGAVFGGFFTGNSLSNSLSGCVLTLGTKAYDLPDGWRVSGGQTGDDDVAFGKLRFPACPSILGRAAVTSQGIVFAFDGVQVNFGRAANHQETVDLWTGGMVAVASNVTASRIISYAASTANLSGDYIVDTNGNLQECTTAGTTDSSTPTWATTLNATTGDGTAVWTLKQIGTPDNASFVIPTAQPTALFVTITGAPAWYFNNNTSKGDLAVLDWTYDYRTGGDPDVNSGESGRLTGTTDCSGTQVPQATANQGGGPIDCPFQEFSHPPECILESACHPRYVFITSNDDYPADAVHIPFPPEFVLDERYGSVWNGFVTGTMTELFWQPPHPPLSAHDDSTDTDYDPSADKMVWKEDDGTCQQDSYDRDSGTWTKFYPHRPLVECRLTLQNRYGFGKNETAPALPSGIVIGFTSPVTDENGQQPPAVPGVDDNGNPLPPSAGTAFDFHGKICAAIARDSSCRFETTYADDAAGC